jgi:hypothetical protein
MARWFLVLLSGCSLTLSGPAPNRPRNQQPVCDTNRSKVALDVALAAASGIAATSAANDNEGSVAVIPALLGAAFIASALHGNSVVNDCLRETQSFNEQKASGEHEPVPATAVTALPAVAPPPALSPPAAAPTTSAPEPSPALASPPAAPTTSALEPPSAPATPTTPAAPATPAAPVTPATPTTHDRWDAFWKEVP